MEELINHLDLLETFGFVRIDEESTDSVRWVWYRKNLVCSNAFNVYIEIEVEQFITDYYEKNNFQNYNLNEIYLVISKLDLEEQCFEEAKRKADNSGYFIEKHTVHFENVQDLFKFINNGCAFFDYL